jgi:hypothetical protein
MHTAFTICFTKDAAGISVATCLSCPAAAALLLLLLLQLTMAVVDSFIVPKMSLLPKPLPPLLSERDRRNMPLYRQMWQDAFKQLPAALKGMPAAIKDMLQEQQRYRVPTAAPAGGDTLTLTIRGKGRR